MRSTGPSLETGSRRSGAGARFRSLREQLAERIVALRRWLMGPAHQMVNATLDEFARDRGDLVAAALAFYTLLSLAPLVIIAVAVAGAVLGRSTAQVEVTRLLRASMGPRAAQTVHDWVVQAGESGAIASVVGVVLMLFTASRLGTQLRTALNQIWNVNVELAEGFKAAVADYVHRRIFAFVLVFASGPLLLVVFASRAALSALSAVLFSRAPFLGMLAQTLQIVLSVLLVAGITGVTFRVIPDTRVGWSAIWRGALLTSVAFNLGNVVVGLYLGRAGVVAMYGAAGSAVVLLLWLYFSAQIFLYGAEFTQVYDQRYGQDSNSARALERVERAGAGAASPSSTRRGSGEIPANRRGSHS